MPLDKGCSLDAFKANVRASYKEGKTAKGTQHVAIALSTLKRACGVADDDRRMSPKEIVASGEKVEGVVFRLSAMFVEQNPGSGDDWFAKVAEYAEGAIAEASNCRVASYTRALRAKLVEFYGRDIVTPVYEETGEAVESQSKEAWVDWLHRLSFSAEEQSVQGLVKVLSEYRAGKVATPIAERFGFDMTVRTSSPRGVGTSRSASPPPTGNRGRFAVYADDGDVKSGDGRIPKMTPRAKRR